MISENQVGIPQGYPLPALAAGACVVAVVIAFNVLGERLFEQAQGVTVTASTERRCCERRRPDRRRLTVEGRKRTRPARRLASGTARARRSAWSASPARASR